MRGRPVFVEGERRRAIAIRIFCEDFFAHLNSQTRNGGQFVASAAEFHGIFLYLVECGYLGYALENEEAGKGRRDVYAGGGGDRTQPLKEGLGKSLPRIGLNWYKIAGLL